MSIADLVIRATVAYVALLVMLRLSGKRVLAEATGMQFVLAIMLGDLVDKAVLEDVSIATFLTATITLIALQLAVSFSASRSDRVYRWLEGVPAVLIQNGIPRRASARRQRLSGRELASLLRMRGLSGARWTEIREARLEEGGELSILAHDWARPVPRRDRDAVRARRAATTNGA